MGSRAAENDRVTRLSRTQLTAGGISLVTGVGSVLGGALDSQAASDQTAPVPRSNDAMVRTILARPSTIQEGLAAAGLRLVEPGATPRFSVLDARVTASRSVHDELRVPHARLKYGMGKHHPNEDVRALKQVLQNLGFYPKNRGVNGVFGPALRRAVNQLQLTLRVMGKPTETNGVFGQRTRRSLEELFETKRGRRSLQQAHRRVQSYTRFSPGVRFAPGSRRARELFRAAAHVAGLPPSWGSAPGLHQILKHESNGVVGVPNYTYGSRKNHKSEWPKIYHELQHGRITAVSSATGLGQLLNYNVKAYYRHGLNGLGVPLDEAVGMLRYIKARYGTPANAWAHYSNGY